MLFRRNSRSRAHPITEKIDVESTPHTLKAIQRTPKTLEEILALSANLPKTPPDGYRIPRYYDSSSSSRSDGSTDWQRSPLPRREPQSKKTGHATIYTDATEDQPAFESDAFAVHMPTTRLPIIGNSRPAPKPSLAAQAEAYRTYIEKARQVRERNNSQGIRVPSKIVSYDYTSRRVDTRTAPGIPLPSPVKGSPAPAGSFPVSPPLPQSKWTRPERVHQTQQTSRIASEPNKLCGPRKLGETSKIATPSKTYRYRADSEAGAARSTPSPTPPPTTIRIRLKPKVAAPEKERVQTESSWALYNRPSPTSSTHRSRSSSPVKSMPNFTRHNSVEGDSIFGYRSKEVTNTAGGASAPQSSSKDKDKAKGKPQEKEIDKEKGKAADKTKKPAEPKRTLTSRWPWLKPAAQKAAKPSTLPISAPAPPKPTTYIDPFVMHATPSITPPPLRPAVARPPPTPRKLATRPVASPAPSTGKFDSGFAQIKSVSIILFKIALSLYTIIALWFILEGIRQAFHTLGAPFRVLKLLGGFVWIWGIWGARFAVRMWEKWGFRVALRGGWMWDVRWW